MKNLTKSRVCRFLNSAVVEQASPEPKAVNKQHQFNKENCFLKYVGVLCVLVNLMLVSVTAKAAECVDTTPGIDSMERINITLLNDKGRPIELSVLLADDAFERSAGFQSVCPEVIDETLILFRYPSSIDGKFHMENVHAPLDIVFFAANGRFLRYEKMETYTKNYRPLYGPGKPFQYALEAPVGFFADHGVSGFPSQLVLTQ